MNTKKTTTGVIINQLNFKDYDQIFTLFTKELGLCKMIFPRGNAYKARKGAVITPFLEGEFIYSEQKSALFKCHEISIKKYHLDLRQNFTSLKTASQLLWTIQKTQMELKSSPLLYDLTTLYLEKIPSFPCNQTLQLSFLLKLLFHEGLFPLATDCTRCSTPLSENIWVQQGEPFCERHGQSAYPFSIQDLLFLTEVTLCRSFKQLESLAVPSALYQKIQKAFPHFHADANSGI